MVQSRVNWSAQQRVDLTHFLAADSYASYDFRTLITMLVGSNAMVVKGLEVVSKTGLTITLNTSGAIVLNPLDGNGSFYSGLPTDTNISQDLPAAQSNIFVEAYFTNSSINPINTASWDPLDLTGNSQAGNEFSSSINSQVVITINISVNTTGFTPGYIPILRASTDSNNVTSMTDCRPIMFRLGTGGTTPDHAHKFPWGNTRQEPVYSGIGVDDNSGSSFQSRDSSGVINDKGFGWLKAWMDAVMSRFSDFSGSPIWYVTDSSPNNPLYGYVTGLNLNRIYLDSESGHCMQPSNSVSIKWQRQNPALAINEISNPLLLTSEGPNPGILDPDDLSTVKWQVNYGNISWELGGVFKVSGSSPGGTRAYQSIYNRFTSPYIVDGGNLYLYLIRDVAPPSSSGNQVNWSSNVAYAGFISSRSVSGVPGDFTGIAVGDWVKKNSEGFSRYLKVVSIYDSVTTTVYSTLGDVASGNVTAILLNEDITTGASTETISYFRSRYSNSDLVSDTVSNQYNYKDSNYYWLGRRNGTLFVLRGYGYLQEGQETLVKNSSFLAGGDSGGNSGSGDISFEHAQNAVYSVVNGYSLSSMATTTLLTIRRKKRNNTVSTTPGDNSGAELIYTINAPVGLMSTGDCLYVRLSDTTSGVLSNGNVVDATDDATNTDVNTNLWQVVSATGTPLRNFDNKDIYLIARKIILNDGITPAIEFSDDSIISGFGLTFDSYVQITKDLQVIGSIVFSGSTQFNFAGPFNVNYSVQPSDMVVTFDTSANFAPITISLPAATQKGRMIIIKDQGLNCSKTNKYANVSPNLTDTIDGVNASVRFDVDGMALTFISNGVGGWIIT